MKFGGQIIDDHVHSDNEFQELEDGEFRQTNPMIEEEEESLEGVHDDAAAYFDSSFGTFSRIFSHNYLNYQFGTNLSFP
ncbi:hypothetical protein L1987_01636 [Smallanthus sonchifolius]|uniref:Uncharacterized protein n=1 Tax=Smallanthus sonchifolius TaxID=185202 RepID=A0ACB9K5N4_9ASTR|nr:hypothetical protein L1987_01636 [Smallanthus sonchifolius]